MTSRFVVDAVEQAIWTRGREGRDLVGVIAHHDNGVQYLSVAYSTAPRDRRDQALDRRRRVPSDNALAESVIGLHKTELIKPRRPWKGPRRPRDRHRGMGRLVQRRRPFEYCDDLTPVEADQAHYAHHQTPTTAGVTNQKVSGLAGAVQLADLSALPAAFARYERP
jgi:putative transposase